MFKILNILVIRMKEATVAKQVSVMLPLIHLKEHNANTLLILPDYKSKQCYWSLNL